MKKSAGTFFSAGALRIISVLLIFLLCLPMTVFAASNGEAADEEEPETGPVTLSTPADALLLVRKGGEIDIIPAVLTEDGKEKDIYLISVSGLTYDKTKLNNTCAAILAGIYRKSKYYDFTYSTITENIPAGSDIVFACHSLGGMIAQQFIADETFKETYNILHTLTGGSPFITTKTEKEGTLTRLAVKGDLVPYLSLALFKDRDNMYDRILIDGGYGRNSDAAHNKGYFTNDLWGEYDVLGQKNGNAFITYNAEDVIEISALKSAYSKIKC